MAGVTKHPAGTAPLRRARFAAWTVALSMAGTTMTFQVYHSIKHGHMPWELAYLYGIVPLAIALCILEFVSVWNDAPAWARPSAYVIMAGAMYLSAESTGAVVLHAAPNHMSWVFGILMDAAALLAVHFILNGPTAAAAAAAIAAREAELLAAIADGEERFRAAQESAQAGAQTLAAEFNRLRGELADARSEGASHLARAEKLAQKLGTASGRKGTRKSPPNSARTSTRNSDASSAPETGAGSPPEVEVPEDIDTQAEALRILAAEPGISGSELGRRLGKTERYGCILKKSLAGSVPGGEGTVDGS